MVERTRGRRAPIDIDAAERLAQIERFALAIVASMIGRGELGRGAQAAGEQSTRQWDASNDTDLARLRGSQKAIGALEAEHVEDDLHRLDAGMIERAQRVDDQLGAHAIVAELAARDEVVQDAERLRYLVHLRRRAVELQAATTPAATMPPRSAPTRRVT